MDTRDKVEAYFSSVVTAGALRRALTFFMSPQAVLRKIDLVDRSYSDEAARDFVLRALRRNTVGLIHVYHQARTPGDTSYDTFD